MNLLVSLLVAGTGQSRDARIPATSTWTMQGGERLQLSQAGGRVALRDGNDRDIALLHANEIPQQVVLNEDKTVMLARIEWLRSRGANLRTFRYSRLLVVQREGGKWQATNVLPYDKLPMNTLHRSVREIRSVSDDGESGVLRIGEASNEEGPYAYSYYTANVHFRDGTIARMADE